MFKQEQCSILLTTINAKWIHPSLALRLLRANLGELEPHCRIIEFALRQPLKEKIDPLLEASPGILGISVSIWNHTATLELLKALIEHWQIRAVSRPLIVLGGPEVSWLPEEAEIFRYADYVIRGEGETAFKMLCQRIFEEVDTPNLPQKTNNSSQSAEKPKFIDTLPEDLSMAKTAYHLYSDEDLQRKLVYVEASRGCPFGCEFCLSAAGNAEARRVREFPLDEFLASMDNLTKRGVKTFKFLDRTFNLDSKRASAIMEFFLGKLENRSPDEAPLCVHFEMVPSRFPDELKNLLCKFPAGSLRLEVGIQTLNPETSKLIGRSWDVQMELEVLQFLHNETNAIVHADLIAGLPGEGLTSFGAGFDRLWIALTKGQALGQVQREISSFNDNLSRIEIQLGILKLLPGTPIGRRTEACGMHYGPEPPYEVLETAVLPAPQLNRIKNFARFWELIVNRNSFPDLAEKLFCPGEPVFFHFMETADKLLAQFGRNWGIDRKELTAAILRSLV